MYDLERQIIFTHPPKTGGTTVEAAFSWHPNYHRDLGEDYDVFSKFKHSSLSDHINVLAEQNLNYKDFFKFTCVRNPWDIAVSRYFHDKNAATPERIKKYEEDIKRIKKLDFDAYIRNRFTCMKIEWFDINRYFYHHGEYCIDYVIRYENYKEDAEKVFAKYNVSWPKTNFNTKSRPRDTHYRDFFKNTDTKKLVDEAAKDFIEMFDYKF